MGLEHGLEQSSGLDPTASASSSHGPVTHYRALGSLTRESTSASAQAVDRTCSTTGLATMRGKLHPWQAVERAITSPSPSVLGGPIPPVYHRVGMPRHPSVEFECVLTEGGEERKKKKEWQIDHTY